ncbi:MAG: hypothetical protein K1X74_00530 [Pirellulales bacterium]|nr:hypothetical protein [Pirellulales bacterium]
MPGSVGSSRPSVLCNLCVDRRAPTHLQLVLEGVEQGDHFLGCRNEEAWNQTWVLSVRGTSCSWSYIISLNDQLPCNPLAILLELRNEGGFYLFRLSMSAVSASFDRQVRVVEQLLPVGPADPLHPPDCFAVLDGLVFDDFTVGVTWLSPIFFDFRSARATVTVI